MEGPEAKVLNFGQPEREIRPEDVRLKNGEPLYYLFLKNIAESGFIDSSDSQQAHATLRMLFKTAPEEVLACEGKTPEEAHELLDPFLSEELKEAA